MKNSSSLINKWRFPKALVLALILLPIALIILILTVSQDVLLAGHVIYEKESLYHYISVVDNKSVRALQFRKGPGANEQSAINLNNPDEHVLEYTKMIFASLAFVPRPEHILVVGLGGGIIPTTLRKHYPDAQIDIVELDNDVFEVAQKFFDFRNSELTKTFIADGRVYVRQARDSGKRYDIIILDAFNGTYIPPHLTTKEFLQEVFELLNDNGCIASNVHNNNKLYGYQQRTYANVAPQSYIFEGKNNAIIVSTRQRTKKTRQEIKDSIFQLQGLHGFSFNLETVGELLIKKPTWPTQGEILTDNFSPVNILKSKKM